MKIFLKLKGWQLFLTFLSIPIITFVSIVFIDELLKNALGSLVVILPIASISIILYAWIWTLNTKISKKIGKNSERKYRLFNIALLYCAIYPFIFLVSIELVFLRITNFIIYFYNFFITPLIFISIIFIMVFTLYALVHLAKLLVKAESISFSKNEKILITCLLFVFLPIGVFFIQPRINKLFETDFS